MSYLMVRKERIELSRVAPQKPKSCASTNSATFAIFNDLYLNYNSELVI